MMGKHRENTEQIITGADPVERDSSDKYILQLRQIHFVIQTNIFSNFGQIQSRLLQVQILGRQIVRTLQEAI